ncbi:MAG: regulatory protein RecX [Bacteroidia bacterium]
MENKKQKVYTVKQGIVKAQAYCAYQERCQQEVRNKLNEWGLYGDEAEEVIAALISDNFLNEERFAMAYVSGKFRIKKWGRVRLKLELKSRKISEYCIKKALAQISSDEYEKTIKELIEKKKKDIKDKLPFMRKHKMMKYIVSKGFEQDIVQSILDEMHWFN